MDPITRSRSPLSSMSQSEGPSANQLYAFSLACMVFSVGAAALGVSYFLCPSDIPGLSLLCQDHHYKYLVPLLVPTTAWFVIANWVGWQYFRYA